MTDALASFLAGRRLTQPAWNCSTLAADWCISQGYPDFAARWRTTVDPIACETAAPDAADLADLWDRDIGDGLSPAADPRRGDIGIVEVHGLFSGAICVGDRWVLEGPRTLHFIASTDLRVLRAWRG